MKIGLPRRASRRALYLGLVTAGASAALLAASPAGAVALVRPDVATGTFSGGGTLTPGLSATPTPQQWFFSGSGSLTDVNSSGSGSYSCSFAGFSSTGETIAHGVGVFETPSSCSGPLSITFLQATYVRVGTSFTIEGNFTASDRSAGHFAAQCVFVPGQTPPAPMTSYSVFCSLSLEGLV